MIRSKICKLDSPNCQPEAIEVIQNGGIIVYPTDTLYGFGVDARNKIALERLTKIKGRSGPWSIIVSDLNMLKRYCKIPLGKELDINNLLPGKVTIILPAMESDLSPLLISEKNTVGIRIPGHSFPISLVQNLRFPITTTSVNKTGQNSLNDPQTILQNFGEDIDLIVDDGILSPSKGSRIIDLSELDEKIIRKGDFN